ncbi:hypothetical protein [Kribbella lupini]|uniref:Sensor protein n=1 Tax=Kribbella lupini TaxID=291602 RepID=A0ABP4NBG1_9ACTN
MRAYLHTAPWWILCLLYGLPFGAFMAGGILWDNSSGALEIIVFGLVVGLLYGAGATVVTAKPRRDVLALVGEVPRDQLGAVFRAARRGPVPADPELRAAALRLAVHDADRLRRGLFFGIPWAVLLIAVAVFRRDPPSHPLFVVLAGLMVAAVAYQLYVWRNLKRRVALLKLSDTLV